MTTASFDNIFALFYTLYRAESVLPVGAGLPAASWDDEYIIAMRFANEAVGYWATYDNTYWRDLFETNLNDGSGDQTLSTGVNAYLAPDNMKECGGFIKIKDSTGASIKNIPIIEPQDVQFRSDTGSYAYFTGDPNNGFTLNIGGTVDSSLNGKSIDYVYYKKPTEFESGSDVTECPDAEFIVHRALAWRLKASRNPFWEDSLKDSENAAKIMKMANDSGNWASPWSVPDRSGAQFGSSSGGGSSIF
jgi:hypothetical protein